MMLVVALGFISVSPQAASGATVPATPSGAAPVITNVAARETGPAEATVEAEIDPRGRRTLYEVQLFGRAREGEPVGECAYVPECAPLQTGEIAAGSPTTAISVVFGGLEAGYIYFYRLYAYTREGGEVGGEVHSFGFGVPDPYGRNEAPRFEYVGHLGLALLWYLDESSREAAEAAEEEKLEHPRPAVVTQAPSGVGFSEATLNASVDPRGTAVTGCFFEIGLTENYETTLPCASDPGAGEAPVPVLAEAGTLRPATTYHYRIVATDQSGTKRGKDESFQTPVAGKPEDAELPEISGVPGAGRTLECLPGRWNGEPAPEFAFQWLREGTVAGSGMSYVVRPADQGHSLACEVTATNFEGEASATSNPVLIATSPKPAIKRMSPRTGSEAGGRIVTLRGTGVGEASTVSFGTAQGLHLKVVSSSVITVEAPPGTGVVDVTVTTPGGTSAVTKKDTFRYKKPRR